MLTPPILFATINSAPVQSRFSRKNQIVKALSIMEREKSLNSLKDKSLDIEKVKAIFENFKNDPEIVSQVAMNLSLRTCIYDREKEKSPIMEELLIELSRSEDMSCRWAVAKNPHTPTDILIKLATDEVNLVRALVAANPNTPAKILKKLFNDEKIVRDGLSGNISTPVEILSLLADDSDKMVRMRVAENTSSTEKILKYLLKDSDANVAKAAKNNLEKRGMA